MQSNVSEPSSSGCLEHLQKIWLKSTGLLHDKSILGCDPTSQTVRYLMEDGTEMQRQVTEVYTRVMGYHRPVTSFNIGKKGEHAERKFFHESLAGLAG